MNKSKTKLVPHELRPANTAQSTIEQNRLSSELKKLERDKKISISQLTASQVVLQKSLRAMVAGGQKSAQDATDRSQTGPSPAPSLLNPNAGSSRVRLTDGTPRSGSRINVVTADPDVLATHSTKSFSGQIIGGQAQLVRKLDSNRNVRMSQSSLGSSLTQMTRSSMGVIMDGSLYNVPERGSVTGVQFTEEDMEQGVHDHGLDVKHPVPSSQPTHDGQKPSTTSGMSLPALREMEVGQPVAAEVPGSAAFGDTAPEVGTGASESRELQLAVPEAPVAPRSEPASPEAPPTTIESSPDRSISTSRPGTSSARARVLGRLSGTSRASTNAPSAAASPPVFPTNISQQAYTRAVERAFATKCLKHSKFVTDLEMNEFVTKYLLIEQQNENFKRANDFVCKIVDTQVELQ